MFEEPSELSPDLDWLLQGGARDLPQLVHALVHEAYPTLFQLALSTLNDESSAHQVARKTILEAVEKVHHYQGDQSALQWLSTLLLRHCRSRRILRHAAKNKGNGFDHLIRGDPTQLSPEQPFPALFSQEELEKIAAELTEHALKSQQRNYLLRMGQTFALLGIVAFAFFIVAKFFGAFSPNPAPIRETQPSETNRQVVRVTHVLYITATPTASPTLTPYPKNALVYTSQAGESLRSIAEKIGVELEILRAFNAVQPDEPLPEGHPLVIGFGEAPLSLITPTPVTPAPMPNPLTVHSTSEQIRTRLLTSNRYWHTLWANVQIIQYGPAGYIGPPAVQHAQVWISQPFYNLVLSSDLQGDPERVALMTAGRIYELNLKTGQRVFYASGGIYDTLLQELFFPDAYRYSNHSIFEVLGAEFVQRRFALVVDHFVIDQTFVDSATSETKYYLGRYWIDALTGLVLRKQQFDENDPNLLIQEILVKDLALDIAIPGRLFDHYQPLLAQFAKDYRGEPIPKETPQPTPTWRPMPGREPLPHLTPPPDFDPSRSRLTVQYTHLSRFGAPSTRADLFADDYYLGNIPFADPSRINCTRSLDGNRIAFSEWNENPPLGLSSVRWLDLRQIGILHDPLPALPSADFAFSPDGQQLALIGCTVSSHCALYLLDLEAEKARQLLSVEYGYGITWSPDGASLALLGTLEAGTDAEVIVIEVRSGEVTYHGPFDWTANQPAPDSPTNHWGLSFPSQPLGLEACITPAMAPK